MGYLISHFKGKYRILCPYNQYNQFSRDLKGNFEEIDCYIKCANKVTISYYGKGILEAYVPSIGKGRNILRAIEEDGMSNKIVKNFETDSEVIIRFPAKEMGKFEKYFKPLTSGAGISPFSTKNLPKTAYTIEEYKLEEYKKIISELSSETPIGIAHLTNTFIKSLATKRNSSEKIKADMQMKGLRGKEYIDEIGQWDNYIKFLKRNTKCSD